MDRGIDDLIYLLLGVIFVVAQFLRKKKAVTSKAPQAPPVAEPAQQAEDDPEDFWRRFLGVPEDSSLNPAPIEEAVPPVDKKPESFHWNEPGSNEPVHPQSSLTDLRHQDSTGSPEPVELVDAEQEDLSVDLRTAVIHSIILERKYV